ncbi:unnamed protein product [Arabidopsis halleri]
MCCDAPMLARLILVDSSGDTLKLNRIKPMIARIYEGGNRFGFCLQEDMKEETGLGYARR